MTYNQHPDDQPPTEWRRFTEEGEASLPEESMQNPAYVGQTFCSALEEHAEFAHDVLPRLVTPESLPSWGDFSQAAAFLNGIEDLGYGTRVNPAEGDPNVAYFKIMSGVTQSYQAIEDQILPFAGVLSMVWRPEYGEWRVHGIGQYIKPEDIPH